MNYLNYLNKDTKAVVLNTTKKCLKLKIHSTSLISNTDCMIGGFGYLPKKIKYPCNIQGEPLSFLAQINFADINNLCGYPNKGILSFYIDAYDEDYGKDESDYTNQSGFRVFYFEDTTETSYTREDYLNIFSEYNPIDKIISSTKDLTFTVEQEDSHVLFDSIESYRSYGTDIYSFFESNLSIENLELFYQALDINCSQIGGHPKFTQGDIRCDEKYQNFDTLLFQIDCEYGDDFNIIWGNCGEANFLINKMDLEKADFSNILYNWDTC